MAKNIMSVDVEDWYHSGYLRDYATKIEPQIHLSVPPVLKLFKKYNITATFFILGDAAEKNPEIVEMISKEGHEIASHGFSHNEIWKLSKEKFLEEIERTERAVRRVTKEKVIGFRAPFYSLSLKTAWFIDELRKKGYKYDSSLFPMKTPLYGCADAKPVPYRVSRENILLEDKNSDFIEYPITIFKLMSINFPLAGFFLRALPFFIFKPFLWHAKRTNRPLIPCFHPWETHKGIVKLKVPFKSKFITYYGIDGMMGRIEYLLKHHKFTSFRENLESINI